MAIIKCKMCGGDLTISEGTTVAECEYCGTKQTVPNADNEKKLTLFSRANRLRLASEFDKASGVYESIVTDFPEEAEAYWGLVLCKYGIEYVDDPATGKKIPTCHRSSFESILEDSDFEQACENADVIARKVYREEAKAIEEIRKGIVEISGKEEPYDIFICYKETAEGGQRTVDSVIAQDVYDALTEKGYRVFFSRISLEDKLGAEYEPYIFAALNSAKIMLAFGTDYEYINAVWVKNEWSRFLKLMEKDKSKHLIPCYKGIDAYDMPKEFARLQAQDMGKVGAMQDLLRGIEKILPREEKKVVQETVVVQSAWKGNSEALVKRGNMALEDSDWKRAADFFEEALNQDAEYSDAYLGKFLAEQECSNIEALRKKRQPVQSYVLKDYKYYEVDISPKKNQNEMRMQCSNAHILSDQELEKFYHFDHSFSSPIEKAQADTDEELAFWPGSRNWQRAKQYADQKQRALLQSVEEQAMNAYRDMLKRVKAQDDKTAKDLHDKFEAQMAKLEKEIPELYAQRQEKAYQAACLLAQNAKSITDTQKAANAFETLLDYRDSQEKARHLKDKAAKETMRKNARAKAKRKKRITIALTSMAVIAALVVLLITVILPAAAYSKAEKLYESGDIASAAIAFGKNAGWKDSRERSMELWKDVAQRDTISAGGQHTVGLYSNGTVAAAGSSYGGKSNFGGWGSLSALSAGGEHTVGLKFNSRVVATGDNYYGQCNVYTWTDIVAISAGDSHTVGLKADGTVISTGNDEDGQCTLSTLTDINAISAGNHHTVCLKVDGTVVAVGNNEGGQCNVSSWTDIAAISAGYDHTVGLKADGTVVAVGSNSSGKCDVSDWTNIIAINAGRDHTIGLKSDGTVVAVGSNYRGQCDVSDWTDIVAISAGDGHTVGLKSDGTVVATKYTGDFKLNKSLQRVDTWAGIKVPGEG